MELKTYQKIIIAALVIFIIYKIYTRKNVNKVDDPNNEDTHDQHPNDPIPSPAYDPADDEDLGGWKKNRKEKSDLVNESFEF